MAVARKQIVIFEKKITILKQVNCCVLLYQFNKFEDRAIFLSNVHCCLEIANER